MKIGLFGTKMVGQVLSEKLSELGHKVKLGTRDVQRTLGRTESIRQSGETFGEWFEVHPEIMLGTYGDSAGFGELLINATAGTASLQVLESVGEQHLNGKIMVDISNPLDFSGGFPPKMTVCNTDSLGEQIQRAWPELRVVKVLNTVTAHVMIDPSLIPGDHTLFMCGDDDSAKEEVTGYLEDWFGWKKENILDLGDITKARSTEMYLPLWVSLYQKLNTPYFNVSVNRGEGPKES